MIGSAALPAWREVSIPVNDATVQISLFSVSAWSEFCVCRRAGQGLSTEGRGQQRRAPRAAGRASAHSERGTPVPAAVCDLPASGRVSPSPVSPHSLRVPSLCLRRPHCSSEHLSGPGNQLRPYSPLPSPSNPGEAAGT